MKLVLDTDTIVAGMRSPTGASAELMRLARNRSILIAVSVPLVLEYEAKLTMDQHLSAAGLTADDAQALIDVLVEVAEWTKIHFSYRPQTRDPADEMVLETAINARADAIVTFNLRDYGAAPADFGIGCWLPRTALEATR